MLEIPLHKEPCFILIVVTTYQAICKMICYTIIGESLLAKFFCIDYLPMRANTFPYAGNGIDCLFDGVQGELWTTSHNCSKCCFGELEG